MTYTRSELLFDAEHGDVDALKDLYLVNTRYDYDEEVDNNAYAWYQTGDDIDLEDIIDDLLTIYEDRDNENYLCTEESAECVIRYLGEDYNKYSLYDMANDVCRKYAEYKRKDSEEE